MYANVALDSPRRRCGKISEGCTSLFDPVASHAVKALTMSHDGALPVIKLRALLNERTDYEWITLDSCFFAGLETASLHFPISPPNLQHALFGYEAISTSITRKVISCSGTFVQLSVNGRQRCWPTVLGWACGIDEVGCLHRCGWILQYLGVWRNHLGTGKVPWVSSEITKEHKWQNSKTRWIFQIWTKLVFTRPQDPEIQGWSPCLWVMLADNWSFQLCVKPSMFQQVSSPATVEGGEVSSFVRCLSAKISPSEAAWIARGFVSSSASQVLSDVGFECRLCRLSKPSPRIFDKPFHVQDMRSRLLVKSWSRGFEEWFCPHIVNPTADRPHTWEVSCSPFVSQEEATILGAQLSHRVGPTKLFGLLDILLLFQKKNAWKCPKLRGLPLRLQTACKQRIRSKATVV